VTPAVTGPVPAPPPVRRPRLLARVLRRAIVRLAGPVFSAGQRLGVHVTPVHFGSPIPDTRTLPPDLWAQPSSLPGLDMRGAAQCALLEELAARWRHEYAALPRTASAGFYLDNGFFEAVDAEVLYALLRDRPPARLVEVGSGFSTLLIASALERNRLAGAAPTEYLVCDPHPGAAIRAGVPGVSRLLQQPVQSVPLSELVGLAAGDILFIDSSHVAAIGSDVVHLVLEVLPRLSAGVLVHVHDIFLPAEYPASWVVGERRFWNEQYLVQAFLAFNEAWDVVWAGSWMHHHHPGALAAAFPAYAPTQTRPASLWLRRR
jgi:hypothetical protein